MPSATSLKLKKRSRSQKTETTLYFNYRNVSFHGVEALEKRILAERIRAAVFYIRLPKLYRFFYFNFKKKTNTMENLTVSNKQTMSSRDIAELTGKPHNDLMKAIRAMEPAWREIAGGNFSLSEYKDSTGRKLPCYDLTKIECLYIGTKFNDAARAKLILRWEELEKRNQCGLTTPNRKQLAQWVIELEEQNEKAQREIKTLEQKTELMDRVLDADEKIDIGQAAKILELPFGRNTMFKKLREKGVFFKNRNEPKQEYIKRGYFVLKEKFIERNQHDGFVVVKVLVTQRGLEYISQLFNAVTSQKKLAVMQ